MQTNTTDYRKERANKNVEYSLITPDRSISNRFKQKELKTSQEDDYEPDLQPKNYKARIIPKKRIIKKDKRSKLTNKKLILKKTQLLSPSKSPEKLNNIKTPNDSFENSNSSN